MTIPLWCVVVIVVIGGVGAIYAMIASHIRWLDRYHRELRAIMRDEDRDD